MFTSVIIKQNVVNLQKLSYLINLCIYFYRVPISIVDNEKAGVFLSFYYLLIHALLECGMNDCGGRSLSAGKALTFMKILESLK